MKEDLISDEVPCVLVFKTTFFFSEDSSVDFEEIREYICMGHIALLSKNVLKSRKPKPYI